MIYRTTNLPPNSKSTSTSNDNRKILHSRHASNNATTLASLSHTSYDLPCKIDIVSAARTTCGRIQVDSIEASTSASLYQAFNTSKIRRVIYNRVLSDHTRTSRRRANKSRQRAQNS
jgi:hypothetical protein